MHEEKRRRSLARKHATRTRVPYGDDASRDACPSCGDARGASSCPRVPCPCASDASSCHAFPCDDHLITRGGKGETEVR